MKTVSKTYDLDALRNRAMELVLARIDGLIADGRLPCSCEQCVLDLVAYTLNHVTPLYGTSLLEPLEPNPARTRKVGIEIELALAEGLGRVRAHPKH